ncbi:SDR family NAD(P)-dependent oxidoreductase [Aspergillus undulatus]|uniref:SDR family NAD(P)-dependent oxidoreductase n=1 Tax=Aspergillus undulatus TaxID=1810928 RepID=UPI003CCE092F
MASFLHGAGFITGAASGIGKATAFSFASHGVTRLALADINLTAAEAAARELTSKFTGIDVIPLGLDVRKEKSIVDAVAETTGRFGRIDYAVNNAGIGGPHDLSADHSLEEWRRTVDIDLNGVWMSSRAEIKVMLEQEKRKNSPRHNRGVIINVASMYGLVATSLNTPVVSYTAAKHGVIGLTRADAIAYAPKGIRINAVCPGYVATPLVEQAMAANVMQKEVDKIPVGRLASMDEIADHITFLASPMSSYMYGTAMVADGGFTIQ